jgi:hypothetical protein
MTDKLLWPMMLILCFAAGCSNSAKVTPKPTLTPTVATGDSSRLEKLEQTVTQLTETITNQIEENQTLRSTVDSVAGNVSQANYDLSDAQLRILYMVAAIAVGLFLIALPMKLPEILWLKIVMCVLGITMLAAPLIVLLTGGLS